MSIGFDAKSGRIDTDLVSRLNLLQRMGIATSDRAEFIAKIVREADHAASKAKAEMQRQQGIIQRAEAQKLYLLSTLGDELQAVRKELEHLQNMDRDNLSEEEIERLQIYTEALKPQKKEEPPKKSESAEEDQGTALPPSMSGSKEPPKKIIKKRTKK